MNRLLVGALLPAWCFAKSITGGGVIQGTVKDSSGGAIPKAAIAITPLESGTVNRSQTNGDGYFATPPIKIGKYKIHVEAPGMNAWEGDLQLKTGPTADIEPGLSADQLTQPPVSLARVPLATPTHPSPAPTPHA